MPETSQSQAGASQPDHPISRVDTRVAMRERALRAEFQPRMAALHAHFAAFVERVSQEQVAFVMEYAFKGVGTLLVTRLEDFMLRVDDADQPAELTLSCNARGASPLKILPATNEEYFKLRHTLFEHRLEFTSGIAATVSKITIQPLVPIEISFMANWKKAVIRLSIRNLTGLELNVYELAPSLVDAEFMTALEAHLLHQPSDFYDLTTPVAPS